jgi:hypothetical protein
MDRFQRVCTRVQIDYTTPPPVLSSEGLVIPINVRGSLAMGNLFPMAPSHRLGGVKSRSRYASNASEDRAFKRVSGTAPSRKRSLARRYKDEGISLNLTGRFSS